ncbi:hypothetical protein FLP41_02780 (plasmid) [Paracoccus marcusii]|uniref:hypothetical protein n=1 Tax=Paracoccus marcusii TaxID=59779 RepID=UPI002ED3D330|nr:hypothetical protein FLP41_02780 [Paracoccus marcusii]
MGALVRMTGSSAFDIGLAPHLPDGVRDHMLGFRPLPVDADGETLQALAAALDRDRRALLDRAPVLADLIARAPELGRPGTPGLILAAGPQDAPTGAAICVALEEGEQSRVQVWWDRARLSQAAWRAIANVTEALAAADPSLPLDKAPTCRPMPWRPWPATTAMRARTRLRRSRTRSPHRSPDAPMPTR